MNFSMLDIVFLIIIAFFSLKAIASGFLQEFFSKAAVIVGLILAFFLYKKIALYVRQVGINVMPEIVSFLVIFVVVYLVVKLIQKMLEKTITGSFLPGLDKALGFFLGVIEGFLVVAVILVVIQGQPFFDTSKLTAGSRIVDLLSPFIARPLKWTQEIIG